MKRAIWARLLLGAAPFALAAAEVKNVGWPEYLGGPDRNHYSPLTQLTPANVAQLKVAWEYHSGDPGESQCNPLVVDGVLYGTTTSAGVFALDAATGRELWRYSSETTKSRRTLRGLTYWTKGDDHRILVAVDAWLWALDARTGQPISSFGEVGRTSLKAGLGASAKDKYVVSTTPGTVFEDLIIMPTRVGEAADAAVGYVQAFDILTGKPAWVFHTIPNPGEPGYDTWSKESYRNTTVGGANSWAGMAIDRSRGIIYVPTGSAAPDFWGGDREGDNLYANCLLALDVRTGKLRWHFQFVHHDLWDRDLPAPPNLVTLQRNGQSIDAVAQITKSGFVFVFDRVTGKPVFPIEEKPFPKSTLPGQHTSPTQPIPTLPAPFARQRLTENDLSPFAENRADLLTLFRHARTGLYEPFGLDNTLIFPGYDGGGEWGGAAVDPSGIMYINSTEMAWVAQMQQPMGADELSRLSPGRRVYAQTCIVCHGPELKGNPTSGFPSLIDIGARKPREEVTLLTKTGKGMMPGFPGMAERDRQALVDYLFGAEKTEGDVANDARSVAAKPTASVAAKLPEAPFKFGGYLKFLDTQGYPAISPPWGSLTAIDLNTGQHLWQKTLGEFKELTAKGIPPTGAENYGGPLVTAGGVLFIAATKDGMLRAVDPKTGATLWETTLPACGFATPTTYAVNGKQYLVITCGGTKLGTPKGDSTVAFALP